jgi:membrane protein DedA with SNARE-associated domain
LQLSASNLKRNAPLLIVIAIALILIAYAAIEIVADSSKHSGVSITSTVASWGYGGVFGLMLLEASSLPIPSEVILPFAGYLVWKGDMDFLFTLAVATVAAIIGSLVDYYIGLKGVQALTKYRLLGRAVFSESQLKVAGNYFYRYGAVMVFVGRLIPAVRTLISFPAGAVKMPLAKFLGYTIAGCLVWNTLLIYVGFYLGSNWREVSDVSHYIVITVVATCVVAAVWYFLYRRNKKRKAQVAAARSYVI